MKAIEIPLTETEYEQLTSKYALTDTGTRWEALREALNLPPTPSEWHGPYGGMTLSVRSLRPLDKRREHYRNSGKIARDE